MTPRKDVPKKPRRKLTERTEDVRSPTIPPPATPPATLPFLDGRELPPVPSAPVRTRGEVRASTQHFFDSVLRGRMEHAARNPETPLKDVLAVAELYARLGMGFLGTNEVDPADVAKLPAPVIQVLDPNAPLPDGKADPDGTEAA